MRNKWAHLSTESMPCSEVYRDADTLGRLLAALGADPTSLKAVESFKVATLASMAGSIVPHGRYAGATAAGNVAAANTAPGTSAASRKRAVSMFKVGELVALRSNPNTMLPVIEVVLGGVECRYRVFENKQDNLLRKPDAGRGRGDR